MSLAINLQNLVTRLATEDKTLRTLINGNTVDLSSLTTGQKTNLVAALNWLHTEVQNIGGSSSGIDDEATATTTTWSSTHISSRIQQAITDLVDDAPTALDTLSELAQAISDNQEGIGGIVTALEHRVRHDADQELEPDAQARARSNIGAVAASDIGDSETDFVAVYEAGLA